MNPIDLSHPDGNVLTSLRRAIVAIGFRDGLIVAIRHNGEITRVELTSVAHGNQRRAWVPVEQTEKLTSDEASQLLLECLDRTLRSWRFKYGKFEFTVTDMNVVHTTFSVHIRPHEEGQLIPLCDE